VEDAVRRHLDKGRPGAMSAIGIAVNHFLRGDGVVGSGWVGRAQRLLRDEPEGPEHGYALYLEQEAALAASGTAAVAAMAGRVRELGRRFADPNLVAGGDLFEGRALTVSLAEGGTGLGTAWGGQRARAMLAEAGFGDAAVHEAPGDRSPPCS
jgi:hypothetical protein